MLNAVYPGTFDPITIGHYDIIERASRIVDKLYVAVLKNSSKSPIFSIDERVELIRKATSEFKNVEVCTFSGLTVDFCKEHDAKIIVRGLRAITDFEYELQIAQLNRKLCPEVDTTFLTTSLEYAYVSSSIVKEIASYGGDIAGLVPLKIIDDVINKCSKK